MIPSNATTVASRVRLEVLPRPLKEVLLLTEAEKGNWEIPEIMQALSQTAGNPKAHFAIMTGERYLTYIVKIKGSQDEILIHSSGLALVNSRNGLGHGVTKSFVLQGLKESATSFEVDPTNILPRETRN